MQFGNWKLDENSISWIGDGENHFEIMNEQLLEVVKDEQGRDIYKYITDATEQDWLTEDELYDLNFAFVYQAGVYSSSFDYEIFDNTLDYQFNMLDEEDE